MTEEERFYVSCMTYRQLVSWWMVESEHRGYDERYQLQQYVRHRLTHFFVVDARYSRMWDSLYASWRYDVLYLP